jgi:hypothetical protein
MSTASWVETTNHIDFAASSEPYGGCTMALPELPKVLCSILLCLLRVSLTMNPKHGLNMA